MSSCPSTTGSSRCDLGLASSAPASVRARPVRFSQAVNTRVDVARRASVVRARPRVCWVARWLRRERRVSAAGSSMPSLVECSASRVRSVR